MNFATLERSVHVIFVISRPGENIFKIEINIKFDVFFRSWETHITCFRFSESLEVPEQVLKSHFLENDTFVQILGTNNFKEFSFFSVRFSDFRSEIRNWLWRLSVLRERRGSARNILAFIGTNRIRNGRRSSVWKGRWNISATSAMKRKPRGRWTRESENKRKTTGNSIFRSEPRK